MNRQAMIDRLVEDDIKVIKDSILNKDHEYLDFILRDGVGFNKMTDKGIIEEFNQRTWEIEDGDWTAPQFKPAEEHYEGDKK
jgi:hypothetical protein